MCFFIKSYLNSLCNIWVLLKTYILVLGLLITGISQTKPDGTFALNGWAMTQFLLSG